jgi:hypothetical protein
MISNKALTRIRFNFYDSDNKLLYSGDEEIDGNVSYEHPRIGEDLSLTDDKVRGMRGTVSQVLRQVTFGSGSVGETISVILKNSQQT